MDETHTTIEKANSKYGFNAMTAASNWQASPPALSSASPDGSSSTEGDGQSLMIFPSSARSLTFVSPDLERQQLYNEFISIYLPKSAPWNRVDHSSFFESLAVQRPKNTALRHGMEALSLAQIGSLHRDQRMVKRAVAAYGQALGSVAAHIRRGDHMHDDDVLFAVNLLMTCELYGEIANAGGWVSHVQGTNRLFAARGPDGIQSDTALLMYSNLRHVVVIQSLISRQAPFLATPEWRAVALRIPFYLQDATLLFYDFAVQVPGMLERFDRLHLESDNALADVVALLDEVTLLELEFRHWGDDYTISGELLGRSHLELKPIEEFLSFTTLCSDRTFDRAFTFSDFYIGYLYSTYWQCLFHLRVTIRELQRQRHRLDDDWFPSHDDTVTEDSILAYVLQVCQSLPYFCEPSSGSAGSVAMFLPMRTAAMYFVEHGHWRYLKWVSAVRTSVFVKGLAPPETNSAELISRSKTAMQRPTPETTSGVDV